MSSQAIEAASVSSASAAAQPRRTWLTSWRSGYWPCQLLGWGFLYALQYFVLAQFPRIDKLKLFHQELFEFVAFVLCTHVLRELIRRNQWFARPTREFMPRLLLTASVLAAAMIAASFLLPVGLPGTPFGRVLTQLPMSVRMGLSFINVMFFIMSWTGIYSWITLTRQRYQEEVQQLQVAEALRAAELRALKSQLNPHFLFNSLNSVRALIAIDPTRAQVAVTQLARTLRYALHATADELVALQRELEITEDYLELEALRIGDRLKIERNIAEEAMDVRVPVMLVQTLVENGIKHGIAELPSGGTLRLSARVQNGTLTLTVENPRPTKSSQVSDSGIGISNAAQRLRLLFGDKATLRVDLGKPGWAKAELEVPVNV
jgi:hypothetical protein